MTNTTELRKRFESTKFAKEGGSCFECCDYEGMLEDQWRFLVSEIEQAEKAKDEQFKEATVKFFKEQKEIAQIRGDDFWVREFDLSLFLTPPSDE